MNANTQANTPKISIIIPTLNSRDFIKECVDSVLNQSLKDIEILCIDANSTDGTLEILQGFAKADSRLRVILSDKKSYGYQMNLGISHAKGEYIGIVESDDFIKPKMYEILYATAKQTDCDIIKSDILCFHGLDSVAPDSNTTESQSTNSRESRFTHTPIVKAKQFYGKRLDFDLHYTKSANATKSIKLKTTFLKSAWKMNQSSIFKREFLARHKIAFNESAGASYQDTGFSFITTICAESIYLLNDAFYCYRTDNENSSSNSKAKVYCICDEYDFIEAFLKRENLWEVHKSLFFYLKFCGYKWNVERIAPQYRLEFLHHFQREFATLTKTQIKSCGLKWHQRRKLAKILDSPQDYFDELNEPKPKGLVRKIKHYFKHYIKRSKNAK